MIYTTRVNRMHGDTHKTKTKYDRSAIYKNVIFM